jgi:18S rRNA (guanine1575-N7)-methyltransferase
MPAQKRRPTLADYIGTAAEAYGNATWMAKNQAQTTIEALTILEGENFEGALPEPPETYRFLDIGCGTGYSSCTIAEYGFRVVGIDLSRDMLNHHPDHEHIATIQADMRHLPFRENEFDHCISISAYNFAAENATSKEMMLKLIQDAITTLTRVLANNARVVIEFYPTELQQEQFLLALKLSKFSGGLLINDPNTKKEKKYLVLQKRA